MKRIPTQYQKWLRIPLYHLFHVRSDNDLDSVWESLDRFSETHSPEDIRALQDALSWAVGHTRGDFKKLLPGLPLRGDELHDYLRRYSEEFEARVNAFDD